MKFKVTIFDDDNEIIGNANVEVKSEEFAGDIVGEAAQNLIPKHEALNECESCYGKFQSFDERIEGKNICRECAENMREPNNEPCNE